MTRESLFEFDNLPFSLEKTLWSDGYQAIAGVDEAGRGALAGPVVAAAVVFDKSDPVLVKCVRDSKVLSVSQRETAFEIIKNCALSFGIGMVGPEEIDRINILQASLKAMRLAIEQLSIKPDLCLVDGNVKIPMVLPQRVIVKGDARVLSIAAASILAKVTRDRWMDELDLQYPQYQFKRHKGYGTQEHRESIAQCGPSPVHRRSFSFGLPA